MTERKKACPGTAIPGKALCFNRLSTSHTADNAPKPGRVQVRTFGEFTAMAWGQAALDRQQAKLDPQIEMPFVESPSIVPDAVPPDASFGALRPCGRRDCGPFSIGAGAGPHVASARCCECGRHGWLPKSWEASR